MIRKVALFTDVLRIIIIMTLIVSLIETYLFVVFILLHLTLLFCDQTCPIDISQLR